MFTFRESRQEEILPDFLGIYRENGTYQRIFGGPS